MTHDQQPAPLRVSRVFRAKPEAVFQAWSSGDRVSRWFCPEGFSIPQARVEMRVGGVFEVCMRAPNGVEHWTRGVFTEVVPATRLVLDLSVTDAAGHRLFRALTEVDFVEVPEGTRMDVVQTYRFEDPRVAAGMVEGAPAGWRQTLDKLEAVLASSRGGETAHS